jgi:hypothetical protein
MKRHLILSSLLAMAAFAADARWPAAKANAWYAKQPWLVGSNYNPATAINELEMWQADSFDPETIDRELGWAQSLGMNTMRVFLHDLPYNDDAKGFLTRIDQFLTICARHKIKPLFVLFDSCWDPFPQSGKQRAPKPGVHNSGWMQSPGAKALTDPAEYARLEAYVKGVVGRFARDNRVLGWDIWNEPDNTNGSSYGKLEPANKVDLVLALLPRTFEWARMVDPQQPLTSGVWHGNLADESKLPKMARIQLDLSDIVTFHNYQDATFETDIVALQRHGRPILCTEYMARGNKSTFEVSLAVAKKYRVAAINWGFAAGKSQTNLPWDSWQHPYTDREPAIWFHEIFYADGRPYKEEEVRLIRQLTGAVAAK